MVKIEPIERFNFEFGNSNRTQTKGDKQGVQRKMWDFTYNNYGKKAIERLERLFYVFCIRATFQEEDAGTPHLQGCIHLIKKMRITELIKIFGKGISYRPCRSWKHLELYCQDVSKRITNGHVFNFNCRKPKKKIKLISVLYDWELDIIDIIKTEPDDRKIYWYWEDDGCIGKSAFCKYLCVKYNALILSGRARDMKFGVIQYVKKHGDYPEIIIIDIPRSCEAYLSYTGMEEIKNACFFSAKYESDMIVGNCPHLICFANFEPNLFKMSRDRWHITEISKKVALV